MPSPDPVPATTPHLTEPSTVERTSLRSDGGDSGAPSADREPGRSGRVPGYLIECEIGRGGMGVVFRAVHAALNRVVAVKMVHGDARADSREIIRFLAEAETVAAVRHPHVVGVYDFGEADGRPYLALEYLSGGTLAERLRAVGRFDPRAAAALVEKLARGIAAAHEAGIVHRDLKPGNVLFDDHGEPRVTDFGLAKRGGGADLTQSVAVMGTPAYMPPEQAKGDTKFVGPPGDVWSLGVILYECLTGRRPFVADDSWALLQKVMNAEPAAVRSVAREVPRELELICRKCLAKAPHERYPTAAGLADDLRNFLDGRPVSVRPVSAPVRAWKWVKRNPVPTTLIATLAALLTVSAWAGYTANQRNTENLKRLEAEQEERITTFQSAISLALRRGAAREAIEAFEDAERSGFVTSAMRLDKARAHNVLSQTDAALRELALVNRDDLTDEQRGQADLLEGTLRLPGWDGDDGPALALIDRALAAPLPPADRDYAEGLKAATALDALARFEAAVRADPAHVDARAMAVLALVSLGRLDDAVRLGESSRPFAPNHPYFTILLASTWTLRGDEARLRQFLDEIRPAFADAVQFNDIRDALVVIAQVRASANRSPDPAANAGNVVKAFGATQTLMRGVSAFRPDANSPIPARFPPFFRKAMKFLLDELLAIWQSPEAGLGNPAGALLLKQVLPGYKPGSVVFQFTDEAGVKAARAKLAEHPEGTLKTLFATRLAMLADQIDEQPNPGDRGRRLTAATGAAFEEAARTPGLLKHPEGDLEEAYKAYWAAGIPTGSQPPRPEWLFKARDLVRERMRMDPPLGSAPQFEDAAYVALWAKDYPLAQLLLDDWGRLKGMKPSPVYYKLRAWAEAGAGNPAAALGWLDRLTPEQFTKDRQAQEIRELSLHALNRERAPPPRVVR